MDKAGTLHNSKYRMIFIVFQKVVTNLLLKKHENSMW